MRGAKFARMDCHRDGVSLSYLLWGGLRGGGGDAVGIGCRFLGNSLCLALSTQPARKTHAGRLIFRLDTSFYWDTNHCRDNSMSE